MGRWWVYAAMPRPKPIHNETKTRVSISPLLAEQAEKLAAKRFQQLHELVGSLLERELTACGFDPYPIEKPGGGKSGDKRSA